MKRTAVLMVCLWNVSWLTAAPVADKHVPIILDVEPAPQPIPALKYQLLPEVSEMNPGNSVPAYLKCFAEQTNFFFIKQSIDERRRGKSAMPEDLVTHLSPSDVRDLVEFLKLQSPESPEKQGATGTETSNLPTR